MNQHSGGFVEPPTMGEFRDFLHGLLLGHPHRRAAMVIHWWRFFIKGKSGGGGRLADCFASFLQQLLYGGVSLRVTNTHLYYVGFGDANFRIPYTWMNPCERQFMVDRVVAFRHSLFYTVHECENGEFNLSGFKQNLTMGAGPRWARIIVRDFYWSILALDHPHVTQELTAALQFMLYHTEQAGKDVFVLQLHDALQNYLCCDPRYVVCFGVDYFDEHPDCVFPKK